MAGFFRGPGDFALVLAPFFGALRDFAGACLRAGFGLGLAARFLGRPVTRAGFGFGFGFEGLFGGGFDGFGISTFVTSSQSWSDAAGVSGR